MKDKMALHETLELHEILNFKNLCLTKAATMKGLVGCDELKQILTTDVIEGKQHVQDLTKLLESRSVQL
ncbi:hypothetical protein [Ornithinibacillus xuwenensis]|uniref:Spore coat protein n=1 Tax=Ornithinibacillus xuwenensis TaxID=3144668 RepID=A0ABU9XGN4_9BACI